MNAFAWLCPLWLLAAAPASAALWSATELQYQYGELDAPRFAGGAAADTGIVTVQHASGWKYLDVFVFVDALNDDVDDGFNDGDLYGEAYVGVPIRRITGNASDGLLRDFGPVLGINAGDDAKVRKWLPGLRLYWNVPGFAFLNTDITAYIDDSRGAAHGGAPKESDSWMIDVAWAWPFRVGAQAFSIEGHVEYIAGRRNEFGGDVSSWILAQPQLRWDIGNAINGDAGRWFVGIEWQIWRDKLGDPATDENAVQALAVLHF